MPKRYNDYREMLEKEDIEIAIISTPDHWHALQAIACVEAQAFCQLGHARFLSSTGGPF